MYDWPECRAETDAEWAALRQRLLAEGINAPENLTRRNGDMPAVPGGIRDAAGNVIAADPATLPPDELDVFTLWRHPQLVLAQTCWGPMGATGLEKQVRVIGQPDYSAYAGGEGENYRSAIIMRRGEVDTGLPVVLESLQTERSGSSYLASILRDLRFTYNDPHSISGIIAIRHDLLAAGIVSSEEAFGDFWGEMMQSGSHRNSIIAVAEGSADTATIDCRTLHLAQRFEPATSEIAIIGWTAPRLGLPYIAALAEFHAKAGNL